MELNAFKAKIKSDDLHGCYIFTGEEDYLKKYYLNALRSACITDDGFSALNHIVFDGGDIDFAELLDAVKAPPIFDKYKLVEWRYGSFNKLNDSALDAFLSVLEVVNESDYTVLAFIVGDGDIDLGTAKKPSKLVKALENKVNILNFEKQNDAQLLVWLKKHFDKEEINVTSDVIEALLFRSGHSMSVLANEVKKLSYMLKSRGENVLTGAHIEECASSTVECDTFALSNAVLSRDKRGAYLALEEMKMERGDPIMIMGMLAKVYSELASVVFLLADGVSQADIATTLKMNVYKLQKYVTAAKKYPRERIAKIVNELARVDTEAKYGGIMGYSAIDIFVTKCI